MTERTLIRKPGLSLVPESRIYWETDDGLYYVIHWPSGSSVWRNWPDVPEKLGTYPTLEAAAESIGAKL